MGTIRAVPSKRANGAWWALVPDGWTMDEWRGGGCAALVRPWADPYEPPSTRDVWELVMLTDDDLRLPRKDDPGETWTVHANYVDPSTEDTWETDPEMGLVLPAMREGWPFPDDLVDAWITDMIADMNVAVV